ncbi:hypothetical protein [Rhizobacter sp. P5_C2]
MSDGTDSTRGTAQHQRLPPLLGDAPFGVDEAGLAQRIAMAAALARRMPFVDLAGRESGRWERLFEGDESLVLARIAAFDLDALQRAIVRDLHASPERAALRVTMLARAIDHWWKVLAGSEEAAARAVREEIEHTIARRLSDDLEWLERRFGARRWNGRPVTAGLQDLSPMWREPAALFDQALPEQETLRGIGFAFLGAIGRLQSLAAERLDESLATGRHEPAAALLMTFFELFGSVQQRVNRFASRHVDFYYRDCLGLRPAAAQPGLLHLVCRRDANTEAPLELPEGTLFEAGKDAARQTIEFRSLRAVTLTPARVAALYTLRVERDPLISPERDLGFATRIKAAQVTAGQPNQPLFGGSASSSAEDARLGLAVASAALALAEGEREICMQLRVAPADGGRPLAELVDDIANAADAEGLRSAFGRLFVRWLISGEPLADDALARLRAAAARLLGPRSGDAVSPAHPLHLLFGEGQPERELLFGRLVNGGLELHLSAADGWWTPDACDISPTAEGGLQIAIRLRQDDPAIVDCDPAVHGAEWTLPLPVLRLELGTRGRMCGFSLLGGLALQEVTLQVKASGVRDLLLQNELGRLDARRAFQPFGPLPTLTSGLVFGSPELARKQLRALTVHVEWNGLPTVAGGFDTWYEGYAPAYVPGRPAVRLAILREGQWQPGADAAVPLFVASGVPPRLLSGHTIAFDPAAVRKHTRAHPPEPLDGPRVQGGLFRLQLCEPEGAFGHAAHPIVLADALTRQARLRRTVPRPNPPYTPSFEQLSLSYEAFDSVRLDQAQPQAGHGEHGAQLFHLRPFGLQALHPAAAGTPPGLLPQLDHEGSLLLGIAADSLRGPLTLLFHLHAANAADPVGASVPRRTHWSFLMHDSWHPLAPGRVLEDTTSGFLKTGTVTLELPAGLTRDHRVMPAGLHWLRLSADGGFENFASLVSVQAQALRAVRVLPQAESEATMEAVTSVAAVEPRRSVPGLAGVAPGDAVTGGRPAQSTAAFRASAGERLRHKGRASLAWDFERLVLDRFPQVAKARCLSARQLGGEPGRTTVVVVPHGTRNVHDEATAAPRLDADQLEEIRAFLAQRMSPWATLRVRNPAWERIQVRCIVQPLRGVHEGVLLRRVERAIVDHLSPWMDGGCELRFDWLLRCDDVLAQLRALEGVAAVSRLSLLRVACDDDRRHALADTARRADGDSPVLRATQPWSLALPLPRHLVSVHGDPEAPATPAAGIRELAIGSTFIVGGTAP